MSRKAGLRADVQARGLPEDKVGSSVSQCLAVKGFCLIDVGVEAQYLDDVLAEISEIDRDGRLAQPPDEVLEGLLGAAGSVKIFELDLPDSDGAASASRTLPPALHYFDNAMTTFTAMTMPYLPRLGCEVVTRTAAILHEAGISVSEGPTLTEEDCARWLSILTHHRIMCVWCLGPDNGTLELQPFDDECSSHKVSMRVGDMVLLRADALSHRFSSEGKAYCLTTFFSKEGRSGKHKAVVAEMTPCAKALEEWASYKIGEYQASFPEERAKFRLPREWVQLVHNSSFSGQHIAVRTAAVRQVASHDPEPWVCGFTTGPDYMIEVPMTRWNHELVYDHNPESWQAGKTNIKHGAFIDGVELFDNMLFRISKVEASGMDPGHRLSLETGYEALVRDGFTVKALMNSRGGVYVANPDNKEWATAIKCEVGGGVCGGGGSIACGRFSFVHGMKGPCISVDLEGASSLIAVNFASTNLSRTGAWDPIPFGLCNSWNLQLSSMMYIHMSAAGLCSPKGRVFAFDASASGYVRGDCVISVVLRALTKEVDGETVVNEEGEFMGAMAGSASNQSGRRAHITAPDASSMQEVCFEALRQADISPLDVDAYESFADARILDDAIEASAASKSYRPEGTPGLENAPPLAMMAIKTTLGNQLEAAGLTMLVKVLLGAGWGTMYPNLHLRLLNPHMDLEICERPAHILNEPLEFSMTTCYTGITNRSIVGTNCHVLAFGQINDQCRPPPPEPNFRREKIVFWPEGGGTLDEAMLPRRGYSILGTFTRWSPQEMEQEEPGVWGYTVTLGEDRWESFQIALDEGGDRILHPGAARGEKGSSVYGPEAAGNDSVWLIDGRPLYLASDGVYNAKEVPQEAIASGVVMALSNDDLGDVGDRYRVRLRIRGKFRLVDWEKLDGD